MSRVDDVQRATGAYRRLDVLGRRLFRDEVGLVPRPRRKRLTRKPPKGAVPADVAPRVRRNRSEAKLLPVPETPETVQ